MNQIQAFIEKAKSDENILANIKELSKKETSDDEIISLAADYGFTITKDDIESMKNHKTESGELNEEDLEKVAGGAGSYCNTMKKTCTNMINIVACIACLIFGNK